RGWSGKVVHLALLRRERNGGGVGMSPRFQGRLLDRTQSVFTSIHRKIGVGLVSIGSNPHTVRADARNQAPDLDRGVVQLRVPKDIDQCLPRLRRASRVRVRLALDFKLSLVGTATHLR